MNSLSRQRRDCDLNPGPSAPEFSTLITRLPSQPAATKIVKNITGVMSAQVRSGF